MPGSSGASHFPDVETKETPVAQQTVDDGNGHSVPLRLYVERIFDEREKALTLALTAQLKVFERTTRSWKHSRTSAHALSGSAPCSR
jgi:hypothetical protein